MKSVIQKWLKFAEADLEAANLLFINGEKQGVGVPSVRLPLPSGH